MTRDEFILKYCRGSIEAYWAMGDRGRFAIPCECGEVGCEGWQMAHSTLVEEWIDEQIGGSHE